jgi:PAS domain S-box-containing protein
MPLPEFPLSPPSDSLLAQVVEHAQDGVIVVDANRRCTIWNGVVERMTGLRAAAIVGCDVAEIVPELNENGAIDRALRGEEAAPIETRLDPSQAGALLTASYAPLRGSDGRVAAVVVTLIDITARRTLEERFTQLQRTDAVARRALEIAHDFNNLLTIIHGYAQLLTEKSSDPTQAAQIRELTQAADRASGLARQLLAFSRQQSLDPPRVRAADSAVTHDRATASHDRVVLVIEDQAPVRALVRRILEREGFGVLEAAEAADAEAIFDEHKAAIALVVTDVVMPHEKGTDLFRRLASKKPELRVVYMSGHSEESALDDDARSGSGRFIAKPFTAAGLIGVVHDALRT